MFEAIRSIYCTYRLGLVPNCIMPEQFLWFEALDDLRGRSGHERLRIESTIALGHGGLERGFRLRLRIADVDVAADGDHPHGFTRRGAYARPTQGLVGGVVVGFGVGIRGPT